MGDSIMVALQVYGIGMVISVVIALIIKGLSAVIRHFSKE